MKPEKPQTLMGFVLALATTQLHSNAPETTETESSCRVSLLTAQMINECVSVCVRMHIIKNSDQIHTHHLHTVAWIPATATALKEHS